MNNVFGVIAEGPTDFVVIKHVLCALFKEFDSDIELKIKLLQPIYDETDRANNIPGGWFEVLQYCKHRIIEDLQNFKYLIIQIDTDKCDEKNFDILKSDQEGRKYTPNEITEMVKKKIIDDHITLEKYTGLENKIIFAISVESTECWLLPLFFPTETTHRSKTVNCLGKLNEALSRVHQFSIDSSKKQVIYYRKACKELSKKKVLLSCYQHNPSFKSFVDALLAIDSATISPPEENILV